MYTHHIMKSAGGVDMAVIKPKFKCDAVIFMIKKMMVRCGVAHHTSRTKETAVILRKMSCPSIISKTHSRQPEGTIYRYLTGISKPRDLRERKMVGKYIERPLQLTKTSALTSHPLSGASYPH